MRKFFFKYRGFFFLIPAAILIFFGKPSAFSLAIGLLTALTGEWLRIWGVGYAGDSTRKDSLAAPFLVTSGPYSFLRNPLYLANSIIGLGFTIASLGRLSFGESLGLILIWALFYGGVYGAIIPYEENFLKETFGKPYQEYCAKVDRIVPCIPPYDKKQGSFKIKTALKSELPTIYQFLFLAIIIFLKLPGFILDGKLFFS